MKKATCFVILAFSTFFFSSCNDNSVNPEKTEITFSINQLTQSLAKTELLPELDDVEKAVITLKQGETITHDNVVLELISWGQDGIYRTDIIEVDAGVEYNLTQFELRDSNNVTLFAAPLAASPLAFLVNNPLPISVSVTSNEQKAIPVEVLSTENYTPADFGYPYFVVTDKTMLPFSVTVKTGGNLTSAELTVLYGDSVYIQSLVAGNNNIMINKNSASYTVKVEKDGYIPFEETFTNAELWGKHFYIELLPETGPDYGEFVYVEGGSFIMGNNNNDPDATAWESPTHQVTLSSYYIGKYEVTNEQFCEFLNANGNQTEYGVTWLDLNDVTCKIEFISNQFVPKSGYENYPVHFVSWYGALAYCNWVGGRLPTEAEWEYAARGGNLSSGYRFSGSNNINEVAWYNLNSGADIHPVGQKASNELGVYDMSGNVWEWCSDWHDYYPSNPVTNPQGSSNTANGRIRRGGGYQESYTWERVRARECYVPTARLANVGIRVVKTSL